VVEGKEMNTYAESNPSRLYLSCIR